MVVSAGYLRQANFKLKKILGYYCKLNKTSWNTLIFSGSGRGRYRDGSTGMAKQNGSVWSAAEIQASTDVPALPAIDWNNIRENREKYQELKWKGGGSDVLELSGDRSLDSDVIYC